MTVADTINACFEGGMALTYSLSIRRLLRDKKVRGYHVGVNVFATMWGFWNLYYYPHLGQWLSFSAGAALVCANVLYTGLTLWYLRLERRTL